jgi:hypothetical protein
MWVDFIFSIEIDQALQLPLGQVRNLMDNGSTVTVAHRIARR